MRARTILLMLLLGALAAATFMGGHWAAARQESRPEALTLLSAPPLAPSAVPSLAALQVEFNRIVEQVTPSVVSVTTATTVTRPALPPPLDRYFGGRQPREFDRGGLGSGVILTEEGHIVTNNHVVAGVDVIMVALHDGRTLEAEVVASDESADLAILRTGESDLRAVSLGDSDAVRVGDLVLAIGNPFGLDASVTNGIVSATDRRIIRDGWVEFVQTNAAINPGNSGGPLVNIQGEVIGINTAIAAGRAGGWQGVGFAVPSSAVRLGLESLQQHGRIIRPHLGVLVQQVTEEMAREMGLAERDGALVREVPAGGPADRAGIQPGDLIVGVAGQPVSDPGDLRRHLRRVEIGSDVPVEIVRNGTRQTLRARVTEAPREARGR
jgi:Do/DeqQ family serine protease